MCFYNNYIIIRTNNGYIISKTFSYQVLKILIFQLRYKNPSPSLTPAKNWSSPRPYNQNGCAFRNRNLSKKEERKKEKKRDISNGRGACYKMRRLRRHGSRVNTSRLHHKMSTQGIVCSFSQPQWRRSLAQI